MTRAEVELIGKAVAAALRSQLNGVAADLFKEAGELRKDVDKLLDSPSLIYRGTYDETDEYYAGNFVTHRGSVWHCNALQVSGTEPGEELSDGTSSRAWTLAVKRGARGKSGPQDPTNGG